ITWLVQFDGRDPASRKPWIERGRVKAEAVGDAMRLVDDSAEDEGCLRASWKADPSSEIVVEFRAKINAFNTAYKSGLSLWAWPEGAPVGV
ncbi:hypothetical protein ABTN05_19610, partial [Acinetobacter baumannii]